MVKSNVTRAMIFTFTLLLCEISFAADDVISFLTKTLPFKVSVINEVPSISARYLDLIVTSVIYIRLFIKKYHRVGSICC